MILASVRDFADRTVARSAVAALLLALGAPSRATSRMAHEETAAARAMFSALSADEVPRSASDLQAFTGALIPIRGADASSLEDGPAKHGANGFAAPPDAGSRRAVTITLELPPWLCSTWCRVAAVALALALFAAIRSVARRQRRAQHVMRIAVRTGERNRIAPELHDTLLQGFHSLQMRLHTMRDALAVGSGAALGSLDQALLDGGRALDDAQNAIQQLRTFADVSEDLVQAMESLGEDLASHGPRVQQERFAVNVRGEPQNFYPLVQDNIYCIAREAVRNAFHHARASLITVDLGYDERHFSIAVRDDGIGISPAIRAQGRRPGHRGLQGMRERAASFGAHLAIESRVAEGTTVCLTVPNSLFLRP